MKNDFFSVNQTKNNWQKEIQLWAWLPLKQRPKEALILLIIALPILYMASAPDLEGHSSALSIVLPLLIIWAGFQLGSVAAAGLVLTSAIMIYLSPSHHPDIIYTLLGFALLGQVIAGLIYYKNKAEKELKNHLNKLLLSTQALDSISQAVLITSQDHKIIYANKAFEKTNGRNDNEILGKTCRFMQGPLSDLETTSNIRIALKNGQPFHGEIINYRKDGSHYWNEISITPIFNEQQEITHFVSTQRDVSERKITEKTIEKSAGKTTKLLEDIQKLTANVPGMIYQFKLEKTGKSYFPYCSEGIRDICLLSPEEIHEDAHKLFNLVHPEDINELNKSILESAKTGSPWQQEYRAIFPDQSVHWMLGNAQPEALEDGSILWHGFISDISEIKQKESLLKEQDSKLNSILSSAADGIILIDCKGKVILFNAAAERIFGYTADEVIHKNVKLLMQEPEHSQHDQYLEQYLNTGHAQIIGIGREIMGRNKNGQLIPLDLSISEWKSGAERMFTGIIRDISERKKVQAQLVQSQKMDALSQLSGGLAHDFNNLLGIIIANLDFIEPALQGNIKAMERQQSAINAAMRGSDITRRLLQLSRKSTLPLNEIKPKSIGGLIEEVLGLLKRTLGADININTFIEPNLPLIKLDTAEFENVLINLAINARDAMPEGGGDIVIYLHHWRPEIFNHCKDIDLDNQEYLLLEFNDNGKGMPAEISERVFEPFFSTKTENGTGLGLTMVYGFVKQLHGHIRVYSELGIGTMFHIFLPINALEKNINIVEKTTIQNPIQGGKETILLVDDEVDLREVTAEHLATFGYSVIQAKNGMDALDKLEQAGKVDLLLSDIVMPGGMDGVTLAQHIAESCPNMAVLLTSGYPHKNSSSDRSETLFGEILHKPYRREALMLAVRKRMDEKIAA